MVRFELHPDKIASNLISGGHLRVRSPSHPEEGLQLFLDHPSGMNSLLNSLSMELTDLT